MTEESTQRTQGNTQHLFAESPTLQVLRELMESRNLAVTRLEPRDMKAKGRTIHASDLHPHKLGLMIVDREKPHFALAVAEPHHPKSRDRRPYLHILVPLRFPHPWWRRARSVRRIDPNLTVCVYVHHRDMLSSGGAAATPDASVSNDDGSGEEDKAGVSSADDEEASLPSATHNAEGGARKRSRRDDGDDVQSGQAVRHSQDLNNNWPNQTEKRGSSNAKGEELRQGLLAAGKGKFQLQGRAVEGVGMEHRRPEEPDDGSSLQATNTAKRILRMQEARSVKRRNFVFPPPQQQQQQGEDHDFAAVDEDPFDRILTVSVQKFNTRKDIVHHWSQRIIERDKRNTLYSQGGHIDQDF
jgi:hypothetical protein